MTAGKVVDASAVAAILFQEPDHPAIADRIRGARLFAPLLLAYELTNVCLIKSRRHPDAAAALSDSLRLRRRLGVTEMSVDFDAVLALASSARLTAYDASYLWLAGELGLELVTLDKRLAAAYAAR